MTDLLASGLLSSGFMPHGQCYLWSAPLLWTMVVSDLAIVAAYYSIPVLLLVVTRKRPELSYNRIMLMFGAFIFACGTTHLMSVVTTWVPEYWLEAGVKAITAAISMTTALVLLPVVRRVSAYVDERERAETRLREVNDELRLSLEALERQRTELERLNRASGLLQVCNSSDEVARVLADAARGLSEMPAGAVYVAGDGGVLEAAAHWGEIPERDLVFRAQDCWALRRGRPFPEDASSTLTCDALGEASSDHLCFPLAGGGETAGVVQLRGVDVTDAPQQALLAVLADRAGLTLANVRMREHLARQSVRDPLTQLFNRGYLEETLRIEEGRARRGDSRFSVAMMDLDHFKQLNDGHGHDAGDAALRVFAEVLRSEVRGSDVACRYGGEEFALVLPGVSVEAAVETVERVRTALREVLSQRDVPPFTVSAGVAAFPEHADSARGVIARADQALFAAKAAGRDRVLAAGR